MIELDLNIDNYNLTDLLHLFNISNNFTEKDMKDAKKIVLKMHPDKCNLDKKYFLFFTKAYKIIYGIYEFRQTSNKNTNYIPLDNENEEVIKFALQSESIKKNFNKWFNELFDKAKIDDDFTNTGYDEWLRSNEDIDNYEGLNKQEQEEKLEEKKNKLKSVVKHNDIEDMQNNGYNFLGEKPKNYSSDVFSSLRYEDLKKAHQETIIPITNQDIQKINNKSLADIQKDRGNKILIPSIEETKAMISIKYERDNMYNTERAFNLIKEDEKIKKSNDICLSLIRQLR